MIFTDTGSQIKKMRVSMERQLLEQSLEKLKCVVDNQVQRWTKNGLLHREDGPALIKRGGENRIEEFWFEGCLVSAAMLELNRTLTPEIEEIVRMRKVVSMSNRRM